VRRASVSPYSETQAIRALLTENLGVAQAAVAGVCPVAPLRPPAAIDNEGGRETAALQVRPDENIYRLFFRPIPLDRTDCCLRGATDVYKIVPMFINASIFLYL
jgi:hypothetical protein